MKFLDSSHYIFMFSGHVALDCKEGMSGVLLNTSETVEKDEFGNRVFPYPLLFKFVLLGKINFSSVGRNDAVF